MDTVYEYSKKRKDFGKHPKFSDTEILEICDIKPSDEFDSQWKIRPTTTLSIDCIPSVSEHYVNTERFIQVDRGMIHKEGGWPKDVNVEEFSDKQRYIRKIEMDSSYQNILYNLSKRVKACVLQNNSIDMYEEYFKDIKIDHSSEPPTAKTVTLFRDPNINNIRNVSYISWHPENYNKLCVAYASLEFQSMNENTPLESYIWDINNPNRPDFTILPQSHLCCLTFNKKSPEHIVGGCYNGLIGFWDLRRGAKPIEKSIIEHSHNDPVYDIYWIQSRSGTEFCSVSTDGYIHWWDARKLGSGPLDSLLLKDEQTGKIYGGTSLEYRTDAGATKFLVGTEQGGIITVERKAKKDGESQKSIKTIYGMDEINGGGKHHAPIYSISRNYFIPKGILTVGDWTTKLWMEDVKSPIITTQYSKSYITCGEWSPTRAGVFFTSNSAGIVDIWDFYYKQTSPVYNLKVSEKGLTKLSCLSNGKRISVGSKDGSVSILELSKSLYEGSQQEKTTIAQLFEREMSREKNLQARMLAMRRQQQLKSKQSNNNNNEEKEKENDQNKNNKNNQNDNKENKDKTNNSDDDLETLEKEFFDSIEKNKPEEVKNEFEPIIINNNESNTNDSENYTQEITQENENDNQNENNQNLPKDN